MSKRMALAVGLLLGCLFADFPVVATDGTHQGLALLAVEPANADGSVDGIATFGGAMPASSRLDGMRALGLRVQGFQNLPLALLRGPRSAMVQAVTSGLAADVYPNERLRLESVASDAAIRANEVQALGIDGAGVGVAIVDTGIDATHPDLRNRVTHNVKIVDGSAAGLSTTPLVIPVDQGPYNDSDTSGGHGTHVAGIVAADNTDGQVLGVAPGAELIGYGTGDAVFIFSILAAYDDMLTHRADWHIRVANNSWGSSFRLFDPDEPINQATKAAHDAGLLVTSPPGGTASASGTSMACPHVAGVVALLLEKRPSLAPDEVKTILQVTAGLMPDTSDTTRVQPFWQSGYGYVDAKAAVDLAGRHRYSQKAITRLQQAADQRVLGDRDYSVLGTDAWTFLAAPATVSGVPDNRTYNLQVTSATKAIKAIVSYPSLSYVGINEFDYHLTLLDAGGTTVSES